MKNIKFFFANWKKKVYLLYFLIYLFLYMNNYKKILATLAISAVAVSTHAIYDPDDNYDDINTGADYMNIDMTQYETMGDDIMEQVDADMEQMMKDFDTWQDNFDNMMMNFEAQLQADLEAMAQRIDDMMDGIMADLDAQMDALEADLNAMAEELPETVVGNLDMRLDSFFEKLDMKLDDEAYMDSLNRLTDKIDELEAAGRFKTPLLQNAVGYLDIKTEMEKNDTVKSQAQGMKDQDADDVEKDDLEALKELFESLESEME